MSTPEASLSVTAYVSESALAKTSSFPQGLELVFKPQFIGPAQGPSPHLAPGSSTSQKPLLSLVIQHRCQELEIFQAPWGTFESVVLLRMLVVRFSSDQELQMVLFLFSISTNHPLVTRLYCRSWRCPQLRSQDLHAASLFCPHTTITFG